MFGAEYGKSGSNFGRTSMSIRPSPSRMIPAVTVFIEFTPLLAPPIDMLVGMDRSPGTGNGPAGFDSGDPLPASELR